MPTAAQRLRECYGFDFPDEFFRYREFLAGLPPAILAETCDMQPAWPFALADGQAAVDWPQRPQWQDRYYKDLPEFVTLFHGSMDGLHYGYFFDAPGELAPVVAHYWHSDSFEHTIDGDGLFEATRWCLETNEENLHEMIEDEPDGAANYRELLRKVAVVRRALAPYWNRDSRAKGSDYLDAFDQDGWRQPVAPTRERMGIVLAPDLYRPLAEDPFTGHQAELQASQVERLAAEAMQLLQAGLPGAALKLGRDLWSWSAQFPECYALLDAAYAALRREALRRQLEVARGWRTHCDAARAPTPG